MLGQQTAGIAQIANETGLIRQTVYQVPADAKCVRLLG
jgi:hypothetical protein